ncbi:hormogonium polysaccharide secretion pseudopilin HpsC [Pseudanabaena sp. Chao 1811]|uniref:hormogonium polysaccharide secretion pseudopilin HpsC n=1 Tax=Pseudanabaena sp. Chao 1811 TaxID=2963092 RepID=UPI0022F391D7|nr:hormogonium polysaccharide secretion pseudopilin HpsC [Pseudanabaena sp. Chao 1811]
MIFSIRKLFRVNRSYQRLHGDRHLRLWFELKIFFKRLLSRIFTTGDRWTARVKGFTLIELLIAILMATVIISTLLAFTVNIMDTDRKEQAKVESQGEVQAALNYISDDLQESVYIYNADSLNNNSPNGIKDQLPSFTNSTPVLVFWKRKYFAPTDIVNVGGANTKAVGCLEYGTSTTNGTCSPTTPTGSGRYTYSLVAYYLIYDNANGANTDWSNAARLGRWEISDGLRASCQADYNATPTACNEPKPIDRVDVTPSTSTPSSGVNFINYWTLPDRGFRPFDIQGGTLEFLMNKWTKTSAAYTGSLTTLIDFIDDTPYNTLQDNTTLGDTPIDIVIGPNTTVSGKTVNSDCLDQGKGVGGTLTAANTTTQRIPGAFSTTSSNAAEKLSSFYVCVNSSQNVARIYLRGNAIARLRPNQIESQRSISTDNTAFLTTGNVRAFGRGKVFTQ